MNKIGLFTLIVFVFLNTIPAVIAHCPLCTTGAVVGVGVARAYGVDDSIVGLFIGAVIVSSALWFNKWLKKKINFPLQEALIVISSFLAFAIPFYFSGLITKFNVVKSMPQGYSILGLGVLGIDKLLFGMIIGTLLIWFIFSVGDYIKEKRGKVLFPYQGLAFMIITLVVLTGLLWFITK